MPAYDLPPLVGTALFAVLLLGSANAVAAPPQAVQGTDEPVLSTMTRDDDGVRAGGDDTLAYAAALEALVMTLDSGAAEVTASRQPIRFQLAGATIRSASHAALDRLVEFAADCPEFAIRITGHSDALGDPAFNLDLSRRRAQSVADYLIERGVAGGRLVVEGAGASRPVADNDTNYGRRQNRRIEFSLETPGETGGQ